MKIPCVYVYVKLNCYFLQISFFAKAQECLVRIDSFSAFIIQQIIYQLTFDARKYISTKIIPDELSSRQISRSSIINFRQKRHVSHFYKYRGRNYTGLYRCVDYIWRQIVKSYIYDYAGTEYFHVTTAQATSLIVMTLPVRDTLQSRWEKY